MNTGFAALHRLACVGILAFCAPAAWAEQVASDKSSTLTPVDPLSFANILNLILGLGLVVGLILGLAWLLRRLGHFQAGSDSRLRIIGGLSLGGRERLILVQVDNKRLLLGVTPGNIQSLCELGESPQNDTETNTHQFQQKLDENLRKGIDT